MSLVIPVYPCWRGMLERCYNPKCSTYKWYGEIGITVHSDWHDYNNFKRDIGPRPSKKHSIERIDRTKSYSKDNCKWATKAEQMRNTSRTRLITFRGKTQCLTDWATELGIKESSLRSRFNAGWDYEKALTLTRRNKEDKSKLYNIDGKYYTLSQWSKKSGISMSALYQRLNKCWTHEEVFKTPYKTKS